MTVLALRSFTKEDILQACREAKERGVKCGVHGGDKYLTFTIVDGQLVAETTTKEDYEGYKEAINGGAGGGI